MYESRQLIQQQNDTSGGTEVIIDEEKKSDSTEHQTAAISAHYEQEEFEWYEVRRGMLSRSDVLRKMPH